MSLEDSAERRGWRSLRQWACGEHGRGVSPGLIAVAFLVSLAVEQDVEYADGDCGGDHSEPTNADIAHQRRTNISQKLSTACGYSQLREDRLSIGPWNLQFM